MKPSEHINILIDDLFKMQDVLVGIGTGDVDANLYRDVITKAALTAGTAATYLKNFQILNAEMSHIIQIMASGAWDDSYARLKATRFVDKMNGLADETE